MVEEDAYPAGSVEIETTVRAGRVDTTVTAGNVTAGKVDTTVISGSVTAGGVDTTVTAGSVTVGGTETTVEISVTAGSVKTDTDVVTEIEIDVIVLVECKQTFCIHQVELTREEG